MKLLKRSEASTEMNIQRKQQVDEGVHIAKRVDALRDTLQTLETQFKNFAEDKKIELQTLLGNLEKDILAKRSEIEVLEFRKGEALKPIKEELVQLEDARKKNEIFSEELYVREAGVITRDKALTQKEKDLEGFHNKLSREFERLNIQDAASAERLKESIITSESITRKESESDERIKAENKLIVDIKAGLAVRERQLDIREEHLNKREQDIINRKIVLEDREGVLARNFKRLEKKK